MYANQDAISFIHHCLHDNSTQFG